MKAKEFNIKKRDPNWRAMQDIRRSGAGGQHKDKKKAAKQGEVKHKGRMAEGVDIGKEWMSDTELDQYVPDQLEQEWRELVGYDMEGKPHPLWANMTGGYEPDVNDPQDRANMVKVANKWFAMKKIPNVKFYDVKDADDELEWLVQIGEQGVAEGTGGVSVRQWANQVRKDHGPDVKFRNRQEGGGAVDSIIATNNQGETVGVYNRKTGYPTVYEPKQGVSEGDEPDEQYLDKVISDLHKDALGFRPDQEFGREWMSSSFEKKLEIYNNLLKSLHSDMNEASDFGEPREILENVLQTLEREVEWPLTDVMDPREVRQLLAPIVKAINDKMMSMEEGWNDQDDWSSISHREFKRRELEHELGHEDEMANYAVLINNKKWKVFDNKRAAEKAAMTVQQKYGKDTRVVQTMERPS